MEKKINIAELLKDCPKGMELDCTIFENLEFDHIDKDNGAYNIICRVKSGWGYYNTHTFTEHGCYSTEKYSKCVIFPKDKTTWEGFQRPFKDGDIVFTHANCLKVGLGNTWISIFQEKRNGGVATYVDYAEDGSDFYADEDKGLLCMNEDIMRQRLATEEEKEKLFKAIKDNGYKWNAETKTLEKLKFDITTLKPFDKVLVRCNTLEKWRIQLFEKYDKTYQHPFICIGCNKYTQCIPYEGNEHLLGTTNDCDNYYKTWK